jgi:hypothetical protein
MSVPPGPPLASLGSVYRLEQASRTGTPAANRPHLGEWGMGGIPHSNGDEPSLERAPQRSEERKRGFRDEPRRRNQEIRDANAVASE